MGEIGSEASHESFMDVEFNRAKKIGFEPNLVFVIMPFMGLSEAYSAIKDECNKLKLNAIRADEGVGSGFIIKEIITLIEEAEFIICDLTHERPNVYYELGYAHGVGNHSANILLIARKGTTLHFDIAPLRVQYYRSIEHLRSVVKDKLREMLRRKRSDKKEGA